MLMTQAYGWYPDPSGQHQFRFWGPEWTNMVGDDDARGPDDDIPVEHYDPPAPRPGSPVAAASVSRDAELQALIERDERGEAEASVLLGQALRKVGRYDEARAAYERGD